MVKESRELKSDDLGFDVFERDRIGKYERQADTTLKFLNCSDQSGLAREILRNNFIVFGIGDDILDEEVLDSEITKRALDVWRRIITSSDAELREQVEKGVSLGLLPDLAAPERNKRYQLLCKVVLRIRKAFEDLSQPLGRERQEEAIRSLEGLWGQILNGEQSTFELVDMLRHGGMDEYLQRVCIDGNTPAFLLIRDVSEISNRQFTPISPRELRGVDHMAKVLQMTDDLIDTAIDMENNQPKAAFFILKEMVLAGNLFIKIPPSQELEANPWYRYLRDALGLVSQEIFFCCGGDKVATVFQKRKEQWARIQGILDRNSGPILPPKAREEMKAVISEIDFMPVAKRVAYAALEKINFPDGKFGELCKRLYTDKINKLLGGS